MLGSRTLQEISENALTLGFFVKVIAILVCALIAVRLIPIFSRKAGKLLLNNRLRPHRDAAAEEKRLNTVLAIINSTTTTLVIVMAVFLILAELNINMAPLLAGAGVLGIALAFGVQSLVKDVFYGFFILAENQFGLGDVIQVGTTTGTVEEMTFRTVLLRDLDGRAHIIPNGEITRVTVYSKEWSRMNLDVQVGYDANLDEVFNILEREGDRLYRDFPDILLEVPTVLGVEELGENSLKIKIIAKTQPLKQWDAMREFRKRLKVALQQERVSAVTSRQPDPRMPLAPP